jgi:hypothetical protein
MQVSITFEVDNAVFEDYDGGGLDLSEVADTLRRCADRIEDGDRDFVKFEEVSRNSVFRLTIRRTSE